MLTLRRTPQDLDRCSVRLSPRGRAKDGGAGDENIGATLGDVRRGVGV